MLAVAGEQPDAVALAPRQDAKAVVLDFMNPNVAGGRRACPSRKTGLEGDGALNAAPLGQHRHAMGDRRVRCRLEPNRRLAILFKCAILAAGGAAIANQLLS